MPKFITIGYGDQAGYERTPQAIRDAAHKQDEKLSSEGAVMGVAGTPVQVRNPEGAKLEITEGSFLSADLPIAGFAVIEANNLQEAIEKVSEVPCAVAHGVVEIWPLK
ncbi:MAG: transcription initiation protein [Alphaproteobacteria bacterium]|nr:transcription initiation protein [Alphaproteobacteria bacterium]